MSEPLNHEGVDRQILRDLLQRWQSGAVSEKDVHEAAERMFEAFPDGPPVHPRADPRSIPIEALSQLEILDVQLITRDDVGAFLEFLGTQEGHEKEAWERWTEYWRQIDFDQRLRDLAGNSYYAKGAGHGE